MLRLSKTTDYGLVLLSCFFPEEEAGVQSARDLAAAAQLPLPTVSKILKALAREGFLESRRGVNGGYTLAPGAGEVSVARVVQALEGPIGMTECSPGSLSRCRLESSCPVSSPLQRLNALVVRSLERVTLRELVEPTVPSPLAPAG